jgi:hypothetical protein
MWHEWEKKGSAYRVLLVESEGKSPLGRPKHILEDNINGLLEKKMGYVGWIHQAQDRDQWRAVGITVGCRKMRRVAEQLLDCQEELISIEVVMDVILCSLVRAFTLF